MHQHFPSEFFKYVAIGAAIVIVLAFLVHLIRMLAAPKRDWLLKQYKEAYSHRRCPVCAYPIARGPHQSAVWKRRDSASIGEVADDATPESPYTCPACGSGLFAECAACNAIRYTLLPFCPHCGERDKKD